MKTYIVRIPVSVDKAEQVYSVEAISPKDAVAQIREGDGETYKEACAEYAEEVKT